MVSHRNNPAAVSKYIFISFCNAGHRNVLQSIFLIRFMFALLNAALHDPLRMGGRCVMWPLSHHDAPTRWISSGGRIPYWPQHPRPPRPGLLCVSVNNSLACSPRHRSHAGSMLRGSKRWEEIPASVERGLLLTLEAQG